jgi:membrane protein YdbS with pleckstrin-like domain
LSGIHYFRTFCLEKEGVFKGMHLFLWDCPGKMDTIRLISPPELNQQVQMDAYNANIRLKMSPSPRMFWIQNSGLVALYMVALLLSGSEYGAMSLAAMIVVLLLTLLLAYRYLYITKLQWTITDKQLITQWGVLTRDIHYVELYRVVDYCERQSFMQMVFGLKDVIVYSNDRTTPAQRIYGVPGAMVIIPLLKELVEQQKKEYHVYEIANR